jgi:hypothetical protein
VPYVELDFVKRILRDDYLIYPEDMSDYNNFAETEINSRLVGQFAIPFDDTALYPTVPPLIQWIAAYLIGYKIYDERTSVEDLANSRGKEWWEMAQRWLTGIVEGTYLLHLEDGTVVDSVGSTTGPRSYPAGVRDKAPSTENVPYFTRAQAGEW